MLSYSHPDNTSLTQLDNGQRHFVQMYNLCTSEPQRGGKSSGEHWEVNFMKMKPSDLMDKCWLVFIDSVSGLVKTYIYYPTGDNLSGHHKTPQNVLF